MKVYDAIIIGAGPAGLMSAVSAKESTSILILEKMSSPAKKLLISGSGQCNITHNGEVDEFLNHYGKSKNFLKHSLYRFTNKSLLDFFEKRGISFFCNDDGKYFPNSLKSNDLLNTILALAKQKSISFIYNAPVQNVLRDNEKFVITTATDTFLCHKLVIATGGKSFPATGSTGDGQKIAKLLGHTIEPMKPALTPVFIKEFSLAELSGNSFENISMTILRKNEKPFSAAGSLLITHKGFSGPLILDNSRFIDSGERIILNFAGMSEESFRNLFAEAKPSLFIKTILRTLPLSQRLTAVLTQISGVDSDIRVAECSKKSIQSLVDSFVKHTFVVDSVGDFNIAMATAGGVSKNEINSKTMESKIVKNLYFAGEVIDIDGDTGGYNLQAAFSTGFVAGQEL